MLVPISWLKEFVDIKLPLKELMWKMTEAGLTCESYRKVGTDTVLDVEVTANRPDWMSIIGVAREVAAIEGVTVKELKIKDLPSAKKTLPLNFKTDFELIERWSAVIIKNIKIGPSPELIQKRLTLMGLRPINNVVDITNYVMFELGIPMHAFDYDEVKGNLLSLEKSKGGEEFTSVDEINYKLPKNSMIIRDSRRVIDLVGIKGGLNSGISQKTKNLILHVTIDNPVLIRRTSQALGLRSDASAIYERGPNKGGTIDSLKRAANLIIGSAGGEVASKIIDLKNHNFDSWNLSLSIKKMGKILGISIPEKEIINILKTLNLSPKSNKDTITCIIPTYRGDLKIEEDLIEEVARIYGYNKFPLTLPVSETAKEKIPYYFDGRFNLKLKELMVSSGFNETMSLSLISENLMLSSRLNKSEHIRLQNPVSSEFEYLRTSLIPSLLIATKINADNPLKIFELDKVFLGIPGKTREPFLLSAITKGLSFRDFKGTVDLLLERLQIHDLTVKFEAPMTLWHPNKSGSVITGGKTIGVFGGIHPEILSRLGIEGEIYAFEFDVALLHSYQSQNKFKPIPEFPPQIEDLTVTLPGKTRVGEVIKNITEQDKLISNVELKDIYNDSYTFRIWYQSQTKTLENYEIEKIRSSIIKNLSSKFGASQK